MAWLMIRLETFVPRSFFVYMRVETRNKILLIFIHILLNCLTNNVWFVMSPTRIQVIMSSLLAIETSP
jgi:hypothetical protein